MDHFHYISGRLHAEGIAADTLADALGTPLYVYSQRTMHDHVTRFRAAFAEIDPLLCYAVKACSNLGILRRLVEAGMGMDVVSGIELERAWLAGCPMDKVVFAGVGKSDDEIRAALDGRHSPLRDRTGDLNAGDPAARGPVGVLNTESRSELERIAAVAAELGIRARVAIRLNPDIDAGAHDHTTTGRAGDKFGVPADLAAALCADFRAHPHVEIAGFHVHLGSPIYKPDPYLQAIDRLTTLIDRVESEGTTITHLDLGGGIGADYETGQTPPFSTFAEAMIPRLRPLVARGVRIALEPGRTIMANAGVLIVTVRHVKRQGGRRFVICDAGMNALIRPSLYGAKHFIWPIQVEPGLEPADRRFEAPGVEPCDVVGPVCESGDFLARGIHLPEVQRGDRLAVFTAGAYGMTMASTYNDQPLPAEALADADRAVLLRPRQPAFDLIAPGLAESAVSIPAEIRA
ncbi:MAG: diaminopimelate decarboxylase [Phycisphaerales bacterium]|nr:diaminopimelate decarboxylase [Planctomycetota bacterium]MCH8508321.1 diaminopimelate decarboxylase [Phycisphaerales bacterium]